MENDNEALLRASCNGDEVALTSAAAFAISYGFAMLISFPALHGIRRAM